MARAALCALTLVLFAAVPAAAAETDTCLTQDQRRAAVATHRAIPLARAVHNLRLGAPGAEVVRARLCHDGDDLVYVLTVLARDGKVTRTSVDAASGALVERR
jgi:uncharacterized membrane protein YkoI